MLTPDGRLGGIQPLLKMDGDKGSRRGRREGVEVSSEMGNLAGIRYLFLIILTVLCMTEDVLI